MLLSYCYIFSHSPPPACEIRSSFRTASDDQNPPPQSAAHSEPDKSLLSSITDWSTDTASTLTYAIHLRCPRCLTQHLPRRSTRASRSQTIQASLLPSSLTSWFTSTSTSSHRAKPVKASNRFSTAFWSSQGDRKGSSRTDHHLHFLPVRSCIRRSCLPSRAQPKNYERLQSAKSMAYEMPCLAPRRSRLRQDQRTGGQPRPEPRRHLASRRPSWGRGWSSDRTRA